MTYRTYRSYGIFMLLFGLILVLSGLGQYHEYYLYGKVVDTQKNPIPEVEVSLRDLETSLIYNTKTNKNGEFKFPGLPHGVYKVIFKKEGYSAKEGEWNFEAPQDKMQRIEIPTVTLVSQELVQKQERIKEAQGAVKEAVEKIKNKDYDGAISLLKPTLENDPKDTNALYFIGICYARKQMFSEAIEALTELNQLTPNFAPAYFELAVCYQQRKELDKALEYYQKTLDLDPNNPDATFNSGLILFGESRMDEALARFEKATSLKPDDPAYLEMAGRCYIHQADFSKAVEYLEKAKARYSDQEKIKLLDDLITKLKEQIK